MAGGSGKRQPWVGQPRRGVADRLLSTVAEATLQLKESPLSAVTLVIDLLGGDVLPWLGAREPSTSTLYLELSQAAEALTIIALRPSLRRAAAADLRLLRVQLDKLGALAPRLAQIESTGSSEPDDPEGKEYAARMRLHFIAPPSRPTTEAHVLRHHPRPLEIWSPKQTSPLVIEAEPPQQLSVGSWGQ